MEKSKDDDEVNNNELQNSKSVKEMSKQELESYRHTPETELSVLVCKAAETDSYADLKDYLEVWIMKRYEVDFEYCNDPKFSDR